MNLEDSFRILGINASSAEEEHFKAYEELRGCLNTKPSNAPTPGLNEKYSKTLLQLDEGIETGEASFDEKEMPIFKIAASEAVILPNEAAVASTDFRKRAKHGGVLSSSRYEYETPAVEAVRRWRFKPAEKWGTGCREGPAEGALQSEIRIEGV